LIGEYRKDDSQRPIDHLFAHHASKMVNRGLLNRLKSVDMPEFNWVVPDGNSSAATTIEAFNREMYK